MAQASMNVRDLERLDRARDAVAFVFSERYLDSADTELEARAKRAAKAPGEGMDPIDEPGRGLIGGSAN